MRHGLLLLLASVVFAAGCGGDRSGQPRGVEAVDAPIPTLRADLAAALDGRAWLVALATRSARIDGEQSETAAAARAVLDQRAQALADRLAPEPTRLAALLRARDRLWAQRSQATARGDAAARALVRRRMAANRAALGRELGGSARGAAMLVRELEPGDRALARAVDAIARGDADAPTLSVTAAARAARPAEALAERARQQNPGLTGRASSPAAELSTLAALTFVDHAYGQATLTALVAAGAKRGARRRDAEAALRLSTDGLERLMTSVYGDDLGERFARLWRDHVELLAGYASAKVAKDDARATRTLAGLDRFVADAGVLLDEGDPDGSRREVDAALTDHVEASTAAIRAQATKSPQAPERIVAAADAGRALAVAVARRIARQFPNTFVAG